jgi:iduronate 2-sulfatase
LTFKVGEPRLTHMTRLLSNLFIAISALLLSACSNSSTRPSAKHPNLLLIAIDDLRPELNAYGKSFIKSPNIDRLASSGVTFTRAYCNVPVCGASRASLFSGVRPGYNRFLFHYAQASIEVPEVATLPEHLKKNGSTTLSVGKIFHTPADSEHKAWSDTPYRFDHHRLEDGSWSDKGWQNYITEENIAIAKTASNGAAWPWEKAEVDDSTYLDGIYADKAIDYLRSRKDSEQPFLLCLGFLKPHLPFNAPSKYWDLYDRKNIELANNPFFPKNAPNQAAFNWGELRSYYGVPSGGPVSEEMATTLRHGYYACVSATDALVGKVMVELEKLGLADDTIVILMGDHGYNLGEHGLWNKHVNFETALRTPLIISGPGVTQGKANGIVEYVDLYPTVLELAGIPKPDHVLQGTSLSPMLRDPNAIVKDFAISKWMQGVTLIGERYFYSEWHDKDRNRTARMLYDHERDPHENINIAELEENESLVGTLSATLNQNLNKHYWAPSIGNYSHRLHRNY